MDTKTQKHVLITGAYGGMGKAAVKAFLDAGFHVFALDKFVEDPQQNVTPVKVDITDLTALYTAFNEINKQVDKLFAVVHFAGIYTLGSLIEMGEEEFVKSFNVNLFGAFRVNKVFAPMLKNGGKILIVTSELAPLAPLPFTGIYAITKSALDNYAYSLRMEVQLLDIKVSVLRPGAIKTGMLGVSTAALDKFVNETELYKVNAARFKRIVDKVEARNIEPEKVAKKAVKIINAKHPKQTYSLNRNPLLLLLNILPKKLQTYIIKKILK